MPGTVLGRWSLDNTDSTPAENFLSIGPRGGGGEETIFDRDERVRADRNDYVPGGKYYSIVKLQIRYQNQAPDDHRWGQGTGWLIQPDLIVTAGDCVFDQTNRLDRAVQVKAYIGYRGRESVNQTGVQFRQGSIAATTQEWLTSGSSFDKNVGFIRVDKPFTNVQPFMYKPTPVLINDNIGVVGYPMDKSWKEEQGAEMYEMYKATRCDLARTSSLNMLEHAISTYSGQIGSPILLRGQNTSIGTNLYPIQSQPKTSASVIHGTYGNDFNGLVSVMNNTTQRASSNIQFISAQPQRPKFDEPSHQQMESEPIDEESFWDTFKSVVKVGSILPPRIPHPGPFAGPVGGAISAVIGVALNGINPQQRPMGPDFIFSNTLASRAILAESALQSVLRMDQEQAERFGIFTKMQQSYQRNNRFVPKIAQAIGPTVTQPSLKGAVESVAKNEYPEVDTAYAKSAGSRPNRDFIWGLRDQAKSLQETEESPEFFTFVHSIAMTSSFTPAKISTIPAELQHAESNKSEARQVEILCHRALFGEAALQALIEAPAEEVKQEGVFENMVDVVKEIGATVIKVAPVVIKNVASVPDDDDE